MQALLMQRGKLWVDEIPTPTPQAGEVLVRTAACGICGSDLHAAAHTEDFVRTSREAGGAFKLTTFDPVVLGHEFCAEVVDFGPKTNRQHKVGDLVCAVPALTRDRRMLPVGYSVDAPGGFGEYMLLTESLLQAVPQGTPASAAALTEPMAVGLHAVNKANLQPKDVCLVLGCGPVGLAVITALQARGAGPIIASDFSAGRRAVAVAQGAHAAVDPKSADPYAEPTLKTAVREGRKLVIFECVGVPGMLDSVFLNCPQDSRIVVVGVCLETDHSRPLIAINKELNVQYVLGYSLQEFNDTLLGIADGSVAVSGLVSDTVGLSDAAAAFDRLRAPDECAKILVNPSLN